MSVTASDDALTSLENARSYLNRPGTAPAEADKLQLMINSYSRAIRRYTKRQFKPTESSVAKIFRYEGDGYLSLAPSEATAITSVVLYTDLPTASWRTLQVQTATLESEFRLEPRNKSEEGTYLWLTLPEVGMYSPLIPEPLRTRRARGHEVTITGNWGAGTVPADVEQACLIAVANAFRNPEGFASRSLAQFGFTEDPQQVFDDEAGASLPRDARALLGPYRRVTV